jgi:hypothetical protein
MNFGNEKRSSVRHPYKGGITFCLFNHRNSMEAESVDVSAEGLKFRSNCALKPDTTICIRTIQVRDQHHPHGAGDCLRSLTLAKVKWCRGISGSDSTHYEVGARFYPPDY